MFLVPINRMMFIAVIIASAYLFFCVSGVSAGTVKSKLNSVDSVSVIALDHIFNLNFLSADSCADELKLLHPGHPAGDYLDLVSAFYRIISGVNYPWDEDRFIRSHDSFFVSLESSADALSFDEVNFYQGCAYGNLARYWGSQGNWAKAFFNARNAKRYHENVSGQSRHFLDAQLTPGVYNYYAATLPKWIGSLATMIGLGGDKELGIRQLSQTAEKGAIHQTEALFMLIQILIREGKYEQALDIAKRLMNRYPDNPFLTHQTGLIFFLLDNYESAEPLFDDARRRSLNRYAPGEQLSSYHLGRIALMNNRYAEAKQHFDRVFRLEPLTVSFMPTHGWIAGSAHFYAGVASEHLHHRDQAIELYRKAIAHEQVIPLIKQKSNFRLKFPMSDNLLRIEDFIHQLIVNKDDPDSGQFKILLNTATIESYPGLLVTLNFACGKRYFLNQRYHKAVPLFLSVIDAQENFPDRTWMIPYSYYYLAYCMATENNFQKIHEYLGKADTYHDYPGEERMRFKYDKMLDAIYR